MYELDIIYPICVFHVEGSNSWPFVNFCGGAVSQKLNPPNLVHSVNN